MVEEYKKLVFSDEMHNRSHDHSLVADGSPIAVAGVPNLPASKITSGQLPLARLDSAVCSETEADGKITTHKNDANAHHAQSHTLASHSTKAHSELTGVTASQHHTKYVHPTTGYCPQTPKAHESRHVAGGADDIDSALAIAAMANLTTGKIWKGVGNRPSEVDMPGVPSGLIAMWHGTIANIPAGYVICDGNNSTPNLLAKFVQGVATAVTNPGATGGATAKTTAGHQHDGPVNYTTGPYIGWKETGAFGVGDDISADLYVIPSVGVNVSPAYKVKSNTDSISDIRPLFYDVAFIMKT